MQTTSLPSEAVAIRAWAEGRMIFIELTDERIIGFPASRFKLLRDATDAELAEVKIRAKGAALRWTNLDEDLTVQGIVEGRFQLPPAPMAEYPVAAPSVSSIAAEDAAAYGIES